MANKVLIDRDELYQKYIIENMTVDEVASYFRVGKYSVINRLSEYSIKKPKENISQNMKRSAEKVDRSSVLEKRKKTCLGKYGTECVFSNEDIKKKIAETNSEKYGHPCSMKNESVREKAEKTCVERYGFSVPSKAESVKQKSRQTNLERYGVYNHSKLESHKRKMSKWNLDRFEKDSDFVCPVIPSKDSFGEIEIGNFLDSIGVKWERTRKIIPPYEIDCYCPEYKIGIEYNGNYWHSDANVEKNYHITKSKLAESAGIRLIHIYQYEWDNDITRNILKSILKIAFGKVENRIYARNCSVKLISNSEAKQLSDANHLQGHRNARITYGLFYNDELVQLMSFSKNRKYQWEIIRECSKTNYIVVGGTSKLFKRFISDNDPYEIFSYADFNKFDGSGYSKIGMKFIGYTGPDMKWVVKWEVIPRQPNKNKELSEIADARIWGSGSKKFLWEKEK